MKKIVLALLCASIGINACKKDNENNRDTTPPVHEVDPANAQDLTAAVRVFHGAIIKGAMPGAEGVGAPRLDTPVNDRGPIAISGLYALITPKVGSGTIAGYYVKLTGANSYFKVDYSKPISGRQSSATSGESKITGGKPDSILVIRLPANVKPGTFCVEYAAYDAQNRVSNVVKACITIDVAKALVGSWRLNREYKHGTWIDPYKSNSTFNNYACVADTLAPCSPNSGNCRALAATIYQVESNEATYSNNGRFVSVFRAKTMRLPLEHNPCSNPKYVTSYFSDPDTGGWSYNANTKKLTIIYDYNDGEANYDADVIYVRELTGNKFVTETEHGHLFEYIRK